MLLSSTSDYGAKFKTWAAIAATCLVGASSVQAESSSSRRIGTDPLRLPTGTASRGSYGEFDGQVFYFPDVVESPATRQTTEQEHLIATIRSLERTGENWDGEGAKAPVVTSLRAASNFVCLLPQGAEMPEPLLHASGRAGLSWGSDGYYGELEFLTNGSIAYYFARGEDRHKGVFSMKANAIPAAIAALLPS